MTGPISVTSILRRTLQLYVDRALFLLSASVCVVVVVVGLESVPVKRSSGLVLVIAFIGFTAIMSFVALVVQFVAEARGRPSGVSIGGVLRAAMPTVGWLMLVGFVAGVAISVLLSAASFVFLALVIGAVLSVGSKVHHVAVPSVIVGALLSAIVFLAPCLYLIVNWSVAAPVVVLERPGGLLALGRSRALVRGNRWRVLGAFLLFGLPLGLLARVIEIGGVAAGNAPALAARLLVGILAAPIPVIAAAVLYFELLGVAAENLHPAD